MSAISLDRPKTRSMGAFLTNGRELADIPNLRIIQLRDYLRA